MSPSAPEPYAAGWRAAAPTTVPARSNGRAAGGVILGLLVVATAASLLGSAVFLESATACFAVVIDPRFDMQPGWCTAMRAARMDHVVSLGVVGGLVVLASAVSIRWRWSVATAALFGVAVVATRFARRAPSVWVGAACFGFGLATTVFAFVPDLVPAWRGPGFVMEPGHSVWLPLLLAPVVLTAVIWAAATTRRDPTAGPTRPAPRSAERGPRRLADAIRGL